MRTAEPGRSTEEEVRNIPRHAIDNAAPPANLGEAVRRRFAALGGVDLDLPPREPVPEPPRFE